MAEIALFSGNANPQLATEISNHLDIPLGSSEVSKFSDGEIKTNIYDNVRGKDVFIIQPTCRPSNDSIIELTLMADAIKRSSADRITAVIPYFGYARQDRRERSHRVPISSKVMADIFMTVGIDRVLTLDLHAEQIQGFFNIPVDNVYSTNVFLEDLNKNHDNKLVVVSPDVGGVVRARAFARKINDSDLAIIDKRRPKANQSEVMNIIGDIEGRDCIIVDDIIDTAGTLSCAANALKEKGAQNITAYCTHAVLSGKAVENINNSNLKELIVTNTIPLSKEATECDKIRTVSIAPIISETIRRINREESLSLMFD